jgi:hypothetical protein
MSVLHATEMGLGDFGRETAGHQVRRTQNKLYLQSGQDTGRL